MVDTSSGSERLASSSPVANGPSLERPRCQRDCPSLEPPKYVSSLLHTTSRSQYCSKGPNSKHINTHKRLFKCSINACTWVFTDQKGLTRHMGTAHKDKLPHWKGMAFCPYHCCARSVNGRKGPMRKDNLQRHIRTKHRLEAGCWFLGQSR